MKTFKKFLVIVLLLTSSIYTYSQTIHSSIKNKIDVNEKNGKIRAVYNIYEKQAGSSSDERAKNYLKKNKNMFGLQNDLNDLVLTVNKESMGTKHLNYKQFYKGIAVMNSNVTVSFNKDDFITMVVCDYFSIKDLSIVENINETTANNLTKTQIKDVKNNDITFHSSKKIYIDENLKPHLIWDILAYVKKAPYEIYYVDAHTGDIIQKKSAGFGYVTGSGQVFNPDPGSYLRDSTLNSSSNISSAYKSESLPNLYGYGYLQGQYAYSISYYGDEGVVYNANNNFNFTRTQYGFKETNAYFFIDKIISYVHNLGFSPHWQDSESSALCFDATVPFIMGTGCEYDPQNDLEYIFMGYNRDTLAVITGSEDESVIVHECGHALHDALINGGITEAPPGGTATGISEGIADYIGISFRRSLQPSNPFRPNARSNYYRDDINPGIRDISSANYSIWNSSTDRGKASIWSSTLMDIEYDVATNPGQGTNLGRDKTTKLLLKSLSYINENSTMVDYINAMFQADRDLYSGADLAVLEQVYRNREFLDSYEVSGTISQNTTWSSYRIVTGDVTVANGVTLTISSNTFVYFDNEKKLSVNGTLNATSTTFTNSTAQQHWGGIQFNSGSSGNLNGCTINNVYSYTSGAIKINNSSPTIQNCTISNNGSSTYGLYIMNNAAPILTGNTISNNTLDQILFDHAGGYLTNNTITASNASINCWDHANPTFSTSGGSTGLNLIQNGTYGIIADEYSTPYAGTSSSQSSYNKLMNQSARHIFATGYSTVYARYNYFERYNYPSVPNIGADMGSIVYYDNYLANPPFSIENPNNIKEQMLLNKTVTSTNDNDDLLTAINLKSKKKYNEAINIYKQILNKDENEYLSSTALVELDHIYFETKDKELFNYIKSFTKSKTFNGLAIDMVVKILLYESQLEEAKTLNDELLSDNFKKTRFAMKGKLNLFHYYYKQGNYSFAKDILSELKTNEAWNIGINTAELLMNEIDPQSIGFVKQSNNDEQNKIVQESSLDQNYPNPFNPTTRIKFTILQSGHIKIKIFDLLGREVANLADGVYEAGKHEITFDASKLPSGIYFYNLTSASGSFTKKMILIK